MGTPPRSAKEIIEEIRRLAGLKEKAMEAERRSREEYEKQLRERAKKALRDALTEEYDPREYGEARAVARSVCEKAVFQYERDITLKISSGIFFDRHGNLLHTWSKP